MSPHSHLISSRMGSPAEKSWEVAFSNISSWTSGLEDIDTLGSRTADSYVEHFIRHSESRYFGVCEHRLTKSKLEVVQHKLGSMGKRGIFHPAAPDHERGVELSGGVGLIVPIHCQVEALPEELIELVAGSDVLKSRFVGARVRCKGHWLNFLVVYLVSGVGIKNQLNLTLLQSICEAMHWLSGHTIVMGDFNNTPSELAQAHFPPENKLSYIFSDQPVTTNIKKFARCIDHILVPTGLLPVISFPRLSAQAWRPHYTLHFNLLKRLRDTARPCLAQKCPRPLPILLGDKDFPLTPAGQKSIAASYNRARIMAENELGHTEGLLEDPAQYSTLSAADLLAAFSLTAEYHLLNMSIAPMDQFEKYTGRCSKPIFRRTDPAKPCKLTTGSISSTVNYWNRIVPLVTLLRQKVYTGWWAPDTVVQECLNLIRLVGWHAPSEHAPPELVTNLLLALRAPWDYAVKCGGGAAIAAINAYRNALAAMQPPAAAEAAAAAKTAAAWDWLVDASVEERKQAVHELAFKVRAKYLKNLDDDLKSTAKESYKRIKQYTGGPPADPKDVVAEQTQEWTKVWCPLGIDAVPLAKPEPKKSTLPKITPAQLRRKAACYPAGKQLGCDNWWMRDIARLPDPLLDILSCFYTACETEGAWPEAIRLCLMALLVKANGGCRTVAKTQQYTGYGAVPGSPSQKTGRKSAR